MNAGLGLEFTFTSAVVVCSMPVMVLSAMFGKVVCDGGRARIILTDELGDDVSIICGGGILRSVSRGILF